MQHDEFKATMNMSFMIGYYQGLLKGILEEIKDGNTDYVMGEFMTNRIEKTLFTCDRIWKERYFKKHDEVLAEIDSEKIK